VSDEGRMALDNITDARPLTDAALLTWRVATLRRRGRAGDVILLRAQGDYRLM
jgi:hypothetical protein